MLLYFVRHGQTKDNVQGIIQGHKDTPLNAHGRKESERLSERLKDLKIHEAWSSPLSRARETAEIILKHHPDIELKFHNGIKERFLGSMEGRRRKLGEHAPPDAENSHELVKRVTEWFDEVFLASHIPPEPLPQTANPVLNGFDKSHLELDTEEKEKVIMIVSHGAWLSCLQQILVHLRFEISRKVNLRKPCYNTSLMVVEVEYLHEKSKWVGKIQDWADIDHLKDMLDEEVQEVADDVAG
ncbi:uncharacterized protein I303_101543 [Kwoniella dejecticola CBS 10117]|uniref:Phosphoglycerate mutase n=1 Tax=Kwoniella dejecticola CBS 10117 TaxID=1296121 RepID=A0A1A6ADG1_9TREE|nr:uncharacterized protein I303_02325 [Kwoniella dejecticola CBS 10117]OBR88106.1 hypothetical protein I303_02325 [Kwoniella dejecticola CBS 10117]